MEVTGYGTYVGGFPLIILGVYKSDPLKVMMGQFLTKNKWNYSIFKGSGRLCKVVKLSMQCCGKLLSDSIETYLTI